MSARRHLNPMQFSQLSYAHEEDSDQHRISAYHPDFSSDTPVGILTWGKHDDTVWGKSTKPGEVHNISVDPYYQKNGIGREMYNRGQAHDPKPQFFNDTTFTGPGKKFAKKIGDIS